MKKEHNISGSIGKGKILPAIFFISLAVLLLVDFFIHKHAAFDWEGWPNFFAAYGFVSCLLLIYLARLLHFLVKRDEDYYD